MFSHQELRYRKTAPPASSPAGKIECRTCLKKFNASSTHYNIHQSWPALPKITIKHPRLAGWPDGLMEATIAHDLVKICNIQLMETDKHSKIICSECISKLYQCLEFISIVKTNDKILKQRNLVIEVPFNYNDKIWPKPIQVEKNINGALGQIEIKEEIISDDELGTNESERVNVAGMDIKIEPEEIMPIKITVNGTISQDDMNAQNSVNGCEEYEDVEHLDLVVKDEPISDEEEQMDTELPLECLLCAKTLNSVSGLKAHVIAHHSYKSVKRKTIGESSPQKSTDRYICATCRRSFVTSTDLMVHETCHNKSVCYGCNEKFETFELLTRHRRRCKAIRDKEVPKPKFLEDVMRPMPEELKVRKVKQALKCSLCAEEFSDAYYMRIHHEIHHSDEQTGISDLDSAPSIPVTNKEEQEKTDVRIDQKDKMETDLETMFKDDSKSTYNQISSEVEPTEKNYETNAQTQLCQIASVESAVVESESIESELSQCANVKDSLIEVREIEGKRAASEMETDTLEGIMARTDTIIDIDTTLVFARKTSDGNDKIEVELENILAQAEIAIESEPIQIEEEKKQDELKLIEPAQKHEKTEELALTEKMETDCLETEQTDNVSLKNTELLREFETLQESQKSLEIEQNISMEIDSSNVEIENNTIKEMLAEADTNIVEENKLQESENNAVTEPQSESTPEKDTYMNTVNKHSENIEAENLQKIDHISRDLEIKILVEQSDAQETEVISPEELENKTVDELSDQKKEIQPISVSLQESEPTEKELETETIKALESFKDK